MKNLKKLVVGVACATAIIAGAVGLVACVGEEDAGTQSVAGTYTYTNADKADFAVNTIYSGYVSAIAGDNATLVGTLTLNEDMSYVLNKKVDFGDSRSGDVIYLSYTFYGTYSADGDDITLEACIKADYEEEWGESLEGRGVKSVKKDGVTDPAEKSPTTQTVVFDVFYGQYLNTSIEGNCDQIITISGSNFTFVGPANVE